MIRPMPAPHRRPKTLEALLPNNRTGRVTRHKFERAEVRQIMRGEPELGVIFLFRCGETGDLRRWGCEYLDAEMP